MYYISLCCFFLCCYIKVTKQTFKLSRTNFDDICIFPPILHLEMYDTFISEYAVFLTAFIVIH